LHRGLSEFERLTKDLTPLLSEIKIEGVPEPMFSQKLLDLKKDEISILAGKSGKDERIIEKMASAARLHVEAQKQGFDLSHEVLYALVSRQLCKVG
jgi:hypothetical protein